MKTFLTLLLALITATSCFAGNHKHADKTPSVAVTSEDPKNSVDNPDSWAPTIAVSNIATEDALQNVISASRDKCQNRKNAAYERKSGVDSRAYDTCDKAEYQAYLVLKAVEPAAAADWIEKRHFFFLQIEQLGEKPKTASKALKQFLDIVKTEEVKLDAAEKEADAEYDQVVKKADGIFDAEEAKAQELYDKNMAAKS